MSQDQAQGFEEVIEALKLATKATREMVESRQDADDAARKAVDAVERALVHALNGEALRGLPDLGCGIYGLRVDPQASAFAPLPRSRPCLVLDAHGMLTVSTRIGTAAHAQRAPRGVVRASHLVPYLHAVCHALGNHEKSAQVRADAFRKVRDIAGRVVEAATDLS